MSASVVTRGKWILLAGSMCLGTAVAYLPLSAAEMEKLNIVERATSDAVLDIGEKGDTSGDLLTFGNDVYDESNANKVGTDTGLCVRIVVGKSWECTWTNTLDGGQITVHGPFLDGGDSTLAVTGGTGKYAGVRGEMLLHPRNAQGSEYDFKFSLAH